MKKTLGWGASVALVAGVLTFTGSQALAEGANKPAPATTTANEPGQQDTATSSTSMDTTSGQPATSTTGATASSDMKADAKAHEELTGRVESFDRSQNTLTLSGKALKVDSSTEVMRDGSRAAISDIKEGDQVRASFSGSGDALAVHRLEVMTQGATGTSTSPSAGTSTDTATTGSSSKADTATTGTTGSSTSTDTATTGSTKTDPMAGHPTDAATTGSSATPQPDDAHGAALGTGTTASSTATTDDAKADAKKEKKAKSKHSKMKHSNAKQKTHGDAVETDPKSDTANTSGGK